MNISSVSGYSVYVNNANNTVSDVHQNDNISDKSSPVVNFGPAAVVGPLFLMTPDGVIHTRNEENHYTPKIDHMSYTMIMC